MSLNPDIRSEVETPTNLFYVISEGYAADHLFSWFSKSLNKHPEVFALLAHEGSRPKYLKERTRGERPNIINGKIDISNIDDKEMFEENDYDYSSWIFVLAQFTAPFNWSGNPAVSLPCGFTKSGLPIGLQLAGRKRGELSLIQASKAFEEIKPWHQNRPSI